MVHVLKCFVSVLNKEFKNSKVYIEKAASFERPSFYISIQLSSEPLNMFYKQNTYYVTIRHFGEFINEKTVDKLKIYEVLERFNKVVGNKLEYKGNYLRIVDRNANEDSMGDLIIELTVEAEDFIDVLKDGTTNIIQNININN